MEIGPYRSFIWNLFKPEIREGNQDDALLYLTSKLANESTELLEVMFFKPKDGISLRIIDELGDVAWYLFNLYNFLDKDVDLSIQTNAIYENVEIFYMCTTSGRLLGEVSKMKYHGKDITEHTLFALIKTCTEAFVCCLNILNLNIEDVLENNYKKLSKRHGENYNADFYQKT